MLLIQAYMKAMPLWTTIICIVSVACYLGALTFFCIKQKC